MNQFEPEPSLGQSRTDREVMLARMRWIGS